MDEGWTRWVLDQFEFEYVRVAAADIQARLAAHEDRRAGHLRRGARRAGAARRTVAAAERGLAVVRQVALAGAGAAPDPQAANDARVRAIEEFVRGGGTLVCFNRSSTFAIDQLKLPVKNVVAGVRDASSSSSADRC